MIIVNITPSEAAMPNIRMDSIWPTVEQGRWEQKTCPRSISIRRKRVLVSG
jgi:hypothetical protein